MGGKEARDGFWFQDAKALTRMLDDAIERRRRHILGLELGPLLRVRIESAVQLAVDPEAPEQPPDPPRPTWDGTFSNGDRVVVDECKLGGPSRDDRVTFYRRLRATVAGGVPIDALVPRLTVGRDMIADWWRGLATAVQSATAADRPPARVDSVEKLAAEALYYLTTAEPVWKLKKGADDQPDVPTTPAFTLDDARALLGRFEIDADSTIEEVGALLHAQLDTLGATLAVDELVDLLGGWINRVAREREWQADLTAESLADQLSLMARYLAVPRGVEQLWHRLREAQPPPRVTVMAEQPWRQVQPQVEEVVRDRARNPRIVLTSEGGVGKSFVLAALHAEQPGVRVWIDTSAPLRDVEDALSLGAWAAQRTNADLTVFIDAIDHVVDPAEILGAIDRALAACHRVVVYVGARVATWAPIGERLTSWLPVRLMRWTDDRVRALADAGRGLPLSGDLIDLLRTPLLLDIFLRTFGTTDVVPAGLATRHAVLRAYFERRVLPESHVRAAERRAVLDLGVAAVLANTSIWRDARDGAQDLVSEGVITRTFGDLRFRHALLRDFSAALQLAPQPAHDIAQALRRITSPIVRNELLRGVIEALLDPEGLPAGTTIDELIRACSERDLSPGVALGTTDAPTAELLAAIGPIDNGSVLRQTLVHAALIDNRTWLRVPTALGAEPPAWLGAVQLEALSRLAELASTTADPAGTELALRLRGWTFGYRVGDDDAWPIGRIGALLVRALPDETTARWYERLEFAT